MNFFQKIFSFSKNKKNVSASFDAAQTTKDNRKHWLPADALSADAEASPEVRAILRQRSRYEIANNSYAKGLVQMLANDTIGTGPRLSMETGNEKFNSDIEKKFAAWCSEIELASKLRTMRIARCQDGETFAILSTNPKIKSPVKLDITVIEADRVAGDLLFEPESCNTSVDGITFDSFGNPVSYRVLKFHPGSDCFVFNSQAFEVKAENMIHLFRVDRPGLHRGIPELTAALPLFAQLRRYNLAVLSAAEAAADFAAVLYTDAPPDGESEEVAPLESIPLERNMMLTVPAGWKLGQLDPKHPTSNHADFIKAVLGEIARCICSTYGAVSGDFSGYNYASGRLDNQIYQKSIIVDRNFWEISVLDKIFRMWLREYALVQGFNVEDETHNWFWDGFLHVDPTKEANAIETMLADNSTTLAAEYSKKGQDWRVALAQRAKEIQYMRDLGIADVVIPQKAKKEDVTNE